MEAREIGGEVFYRIKGFSNIKKIKDLPKSYLQRAPYFYLEDNEEVVFLKTDKPLSLHVKMGWDPCIIHIQKGGIWPENEWVEVMSLLKQAGARLHTILQEKKKKIKVIEFLI